MQGDTTACKRLCSPGCVAHTDGAVFQFGTTDVVHCNWQGTHYTSTDSFSAQVSWEFFEMHPKPGMPHPVVGEGGRHHCNDGLDNDADGVADCDDPGCATLSFCRAAAAGPAEP